ncbi:MAG: pyridoxal phosphate-dependent aminotransferase [Candidatus Zixiibacteriota bacterium]
MTSRLEKRDLQHKSTGIRPTTAVARLASYCGDPENFAHQNGGGDLCKLDCNESTQAPTSEIVGAIVASLSDGGVNRYPVATGQALLDELSGYVELDNEYIQTYPGSSAALETICRTFLEQDDEALIAGPSEAHIRRYAGVCGAKSRLHLAPSPFESDACGLRQSVTPSTRLIYMANPGNPTGVVYTQREIERILECFPQTLLVVDEALVEFHGESCAQLVRSHSNLIITRSFSGAFGLAGMRCGYILAAPEILEYTNRVRDRSHLSAPAQAAATAALRYRGQTMEYIRQVRENRTYLALRLENMGGKAKITPANFILLKSPQPEKMIRFLRDRNILVRDLGSVPQLEGYVRITIGDNKSCACVVMAFEEMPEPYYRTLTDDECLAQGVLLPRRTQSLAFRRSPEVTGQSVGPDVAGRLSRSGAAQESGSYKENELSESREFSVASAAERGQ